MTTCANPPCGRLAADDDRYQDGFGDVFCGVPCLMTVGKYPMVDCPVCGRPTKSIDLEMFDNQCSSCIQGKFDEAGYPFDLDYEMEEEYD